MPAVCFYFQVHQPFRIKKYSIFDIGQDHNYFDTEDEKTNNVRILEKVSQKCYLPTNALLLKLLQENPEFKISFSLSGVFLEQIQAYQPAVLESFQALVKTGQVEILSETYFHSLSFLYSKHEFEAQVKAHDKLVKQLFGVKPQVFRNTELIYNNDLAQTVEKMGFKGVISEGADHILGDHSPNFLYKPTGTKNIKLLLKNYRLSDDIGFRFSDQNWSGFPLTAHKFASWVDQFNGNGEVINLFMDYETFGEHQWEHTGIFQFLEHLPAAILANVDNAFLTPSEVVAKFEARNELDIPEFISWADAERDLSAWRSNAMQIDAMDKIYALEEPVKDTKDESLIHEWRKLQTSDHFYYMCTKFFQDGDIHTYFSPYQSPYEAFMYYMNVLKDFVLRLEMVPVKVKE
jgi:alpha-amylase